VLKRVIVGALIVAVLAWAVWRLSAPERAGAPLPARPDSMSTGLRAARLFFAAPSGDSLVSESRDLPESGTLHERVASLIAELVRGPRGTAVGLLPPGTLLLHVYLDDRGLMTLDLSSEFLSGFRGGSTAEGLTIASLVRTLSANVTETRRLQIVCAGEPIPTLGGHLPLDRPLDVQDW
jgi:spore germination protein GerM